MVGGSAAFRSPNFFVLLLTNDRASLPPPSPFPLTYNEKYSTGMLMSNIYGQPTSSDQSVDDSQASVRPTTEMMSDLNLYVNSCTAATLTNMLAKVIEFTYGSDSAGFDASAHPMYKTQPHDVGFEAILTCIRSLISQNHQTFANVAGEVLVITLIKMIAIRADIVKRPNSPRISDGCVIDAVSCLHYLAIHGFRKVLFPPRAHIAIGDKSHPNDHDVTCKQRDQYKKGTQHYTLSDAALHRLLRSPRVACHFAQARFRKLGI